MKFSIEKNDLVQALGNVHGVVEARTTIPILSNVMIRAEAGEIHLATTDMDMAMVERKPARISIDGSLTVPVRTFYEIIKKLPDGAQINLEQDSNTGQLNINAGQASFHLPTLPADDFPVLSEGEFDHHFHLDSKQLHHLIETTRFAISMEETRYYLNGIYMHILQEGETAQLATVATDGHRLAKAVTEAPEGSEALAGVIVPRKAINELHHLLNQHEGTVEIAVSDSKIRFAIAGAILTTKLIDGKFPDYARVIPTNNDQCLTIACKLFGKSVDLVQTIASDKVRAVKMEISTNKLVLSASAQENGAARQELECEYSGSELAIGFNARYLLDMTQQIGSGELSMLFANSTAPALIKNPNDKNILFVLMPMRV
ncbi:MAG: DNA polymerase III subunit beta [Pseudomonadota bacterium]